MYPIDNQYNIPLFCGLHNFFFNALRVDISKSIVKVKGDTLLIKDFFDLTSVDVYVKQKIPKEWLIYKADW
jgi:hypothetical protein